MRALNSAGIGMPHLHRFLAYADAYLELTKPRVVLLIVFTAVVGMFVATPGFVPLDILLFATLGISMAAGSAAAFNHILDRRADAIMARTRARPLPAGQVTPRQAVTFAVTLASLSMATLVLGVNALTAILTFLSLIGYSVIYTLFLKPTTPQNIVIGGVAGAAPPVLGWTSVTGSVSGEALILFLIIFIWTPPHFWSLALYRTREYAKAGIPMLPVTHGREFTCKFILLYTILLSAVTLMPFATNMSGFLYLVGAVTLDARFITYAWRLCRNYSDAVARKAFSYSITYLTLLFAALLVDHYRIAIYNILRSIFF